MSLFVDLNRVFCTKDEAGNKHFRSFNDDETIIGNQFNINKEIKFHYSRTNTTDCNGYIQIGDDDHRIIIGIVEAESVNHITLKDNFSRDIWSYRLSELNDSNSFDISLKIEFDTQDIESLQLGDDFHYYFRLTINGTKKLNYSAQVSFTPDEAKIFLNRNYISKVVQDANARITDLTFSTDGVYVEKRDMTNKIDKLQRTVTTFNPIDYVVEEDGADWYNDDTVILPTQGNTITFNFTDMLNDTGDYFEWELGALHGTVWLVDGEHSDEIWDSNVNSMIRIKITKNKNSESYHITTTDLSNNTIIKDYDKDYHFNLTFLTLNGGRISFSNKKWYHTVSFIDMIYPIGSIYMSVNSINPSLFIGGIWEQIQDRFLLASGRTYQSGSTGGSATVALTKAQMPRHNHTQAQHRHKQGNKYSDGNGSEGAYTYSSNRKATDHYTDYQTPVINHTGGTGTTNADANGSPHENMPPYVVVYMWKRIA